MLSTQDSELNEMLSTQDSEIKELIIRISDLQYEFLPLGLGKQLNASYLIYSKFLTNTKKKWINKSNIN